MINKKFFRAVVGARIRYLRTLQGMDQCRLAEATGIDASVLSRMENGSYGIDSADAVRVGKILGISLDALLAVPEGEPEHAQ
jgi:transcriptional regulator with XRE-family HTH domain